MDELKGIEIAKRLIKKFLISEYEEEEDNIKFNDISHIPIAHTQTEDGEHDIDVVVDLKNYSINKHLDGTVVESITSKNIHELISKELTTLEFSDLVYLDDKTIETFKENSKEYNLNTPIGKIPFTKKESEYYSKLTDFELMKLYIKERKENNFINPHTFEVMASRNLIFKGEKIEDVEGRLKSMSEIKKGDYIKTGASENTLVLKVKDNDAILFTGNQFIVAHGIQKNGDRAYWMFGDYYDELPDEVFDKDKKMEEEQENDWDMEL